MPLKKVEVRGDGNCGFYAIFESARLQGLSERFMKLSYSDGTGTHRLADVMPKSIDTDPLNKDNEDLQDRFSAFCRKTLRHKHVYSEALSDFFDSYKEIGVEAWANTFLTLLHTQHQIAAEFSHVRKQIFKNKCASNQFIYLDGSQAPPDYEQDCLEKLKLRFVDYMKNRIEDNTSDYKAYICQPEITALTHILGSIGINLDTNGPESKVRRPENTVYILPVGDHYSCYVPVRKEEHEVIRAIDEANALFEERKQELADAALARQIYETELAKQKEQDAMQRDRFPRFREWLKRNHLWFTQKYSSFKNYFKKGGSSRRKNTTLKHGRSIRPLRPFGDSANAPRRRRKVRSRHSS